MRSFTFFAAAFILFISTVISAQNNGILRGFVADSLTGEVLPYANVLIKELDRGSSTNSRGYFIMASLPVSKLTVRVSYVGYKPNQMEVEIAADKVTEITVNLIPSTVQVNTVEVVGKKSFDENAVGQGVQKITMHEIENLPKGIETDVFRAIQNLPGVQSGGDLAGKYYVRGGSSNENLILLDNVPIYNPYHAMGILSVIDPDMINSVEFYKGGFPVDYTGCLSSVLKINTKDGNKNSFGGKAGISLLTAKLLLEGPIPAGSIIITGRKNYTDDVLKKFRNNNSLPSDFYDLFAKINISSDDFIQGAKFSLGTFLSSDKISNNNPMLEDFNWKNSTIDFNYFQLSDTPLFYQVDISMSSFRGERIPNESGSKYLLNEFDRYSMRADFNYVYESKDVLAGGIAITEIHLNQKINNIVGETAVSADKGTSLSAFVKYQWLRNTLFSSETGVRLHATRFAGGGPSFFLEPRASFALKITDDLVFKSSWGLFMQDLVTVSDENEVAPVFEPWQITPSYLKPSDAIHYISGFEINPAVNLKFDIDGYYKIIHHLAIVNPSKLYLSSPDFIDGSGKAYGLEFSANYKLQPFQLLCSYSWMKAEREVYGFKFPPRFDSRNNISITLEADLGAGWNASAIWNFSSGMPFTQIAGYYDKLTPTLIGGNPFVLNNYSPFTILGTWNMGRLTDYHRLDLSLSKRIYIGRFRMSIDVSALNVYDRKNIYYFKRDTGEIVNMLPFLPSVNFKVEL